MKKSLWLVNLLFVFTLLLLPSVLSADIEIVFPAEGTYGPWSGTYKTHESGKAHFITPNIIVNKEVIDNYELYDNGNLIGSFEASDVNPTTAVIIDPGLHTFVAKGYKNNQVVGEVQVKTDFVFNYFDVFKSVKELDPVVVSFEVTEEDFAQIDANLEDYQKTMEHVTLKKSFIHVTVKDKFTGEEKENTLVVVKISIDEAVKDLKVYELIPKTVAQHINNLTLMGNYTILEEDPLVVWTFAGIDASAVKELEVSYAVNDFVLEEDFEEVKTIPIAEIKPKKTYLYYLLPLLLVPIIIFIVIYFGKFQKEE
ncbi:hypothetical protein HYY69_01415 [Candidatus Woesearchaeota archaeon]|nr:hypothetical protein [Candidatus Woesearchaeota archaeon]